MGVVLLIVLHVQVEGSELEGLEGGLRENLQC
jgi:hypothetical protein